MNDSTADSPRRRLLDGLAIPVIGAPMLIPCRPALTIAQCKAGIIGAFPALSARPSQELDDWLFEIEDELARHRKENPGRKAGPVAVNQIVHKSNARLEQDMEICVRHKVPIIITSVGARPDVVKEVQGYGGIVFHDVLNMRHVEKAATHGVDGMVLLCAGAGGQGGYINPFAFVAEARRHFDGMLAVAGCVTNGRSVAAVRALGADFAYVGTRFIATHEARSLQPHKEMITQCSADDILYTDRINGIFGNFLRPSLVRAGLDPDNLTLSAELLERMDDDAPKIYKDLWPAGQGVGDIDDIASVETVVARMCAEYSDALRAARP